MAFSLGTKSHSVPEQNHFRTGYMGTETELDVDVRARNLIKYIHSLSTKEKANQAVFTIF